MVGAALRGLIHTALLRGAGHPHESPAVAAQDDSTVDIVPLIRNPLERQTADPEAAAALYRTVNNIGRDSVRESGS
jgi:hypothetical protein